METLYNIVEFTTQTASIEFNKKLLTDFLNMKY